MLELRFLLNGQWLHFLLFHQPNHIHVRDVIIIHSACINTNCSGVSNGFLCLVWCQIHTSSLCFMGTLRKVPLCLTSLGSSKVNFLICGFRCLLSSILSGESHSNLDGERSVSYLLILGDDYSASHQHKAYFLVFPLQIWLSPAWA